MLKDDDIWRAGATFLPGPQTTCKSQRRWYLEAKDLLFCKNRYTFRVLLGTFWRKTPQPKTSIGRKKGVPPREPDNEKRRSAICSTQLNSAQLSSTQLNSTDVTDRPCKPGSSRRGARMMVVRQANSLKQHDSNYTTLQHYNMLISECHNVINI